MSTPNPVPSQPVAAPWYKTDVIRGALIAFVAYWIKQAKLEAYIPLASAPQVVDFLTDTVITSALTYVVHARATKHLPQITFTKAAAVAINQAAAAASVTQGVPDVQNSPVAPTAVVVDHHPDGPG